MIIDDVGVNSTGHEQLAKKKKEEKIIIWKKMMDDNNVRHFVNKRERYAEKKSCRWSQLLKRSRVKQ